MWPPPNTQWSEDWLQMYIAMESNRLGILMHADGNGNYVNGKTAGKKKLMGSLAGWPDMVFILEGRIVWIELKTIVGKLSKEQRDAHRRMIDMGCEVWVVKALDGRDAWGKVCGILGL